MTTPTLVTGAPGNVGTPLVEELLRLGTRVRIAAWDVTGPRGWRGPSSVRHEFIHDARAVWRRSHEVAAPAGT